MPTESNGTQNIIHYSQCSKVRKKTQNGYRLEKNAKIFLDSQTIWFSTTENSKQSKNSLELIHEFISSQDTRTHKQKINYISIN